MFILKFLKTPFLSEVKLVISVKLKHLTLTSVSESHRIFCRLRLHAYMYNSPGGTSPLQHGDCQNSDLHGWDVFEIKQSLNYWRIEQFKNWFTVTSVYSWALHVWHQSVDLEKHHISFLIKPVEYMWNNQKCTHLLLVLLLLMSLKI